MDSPFDLSSFIAFPNTAGSAQHPSPANTTQTKQDESPSSSKLKLGNGGGGGGQAHQNQQPQPQQPQQYQQQQQQQQRQGPAESSELYNAFAAGIRATAKQAGQVNGNNKMVGMSLVPGGKMGIQQQQQQKQQQQLQQGNGLGQGSKQKQVQGQGQTDTDGSNNPNTTSSAQPSVDLNPNPTTIPTPKSFSNLNLSPYGLDPSAFQSEVRFQLPAFLNPTNGVPTHPGGAEAFSGFSIGQGTMDGLFSGMGSGGVSSPWGNGGMGMGGFGNGMGMGMGNGMDGFNKWENQAYSGKGYDQWGGGYGSDASQNFGLNPQQTNTLQQQQNNYLQTTFGDMQNLENQNNGNVNTSSVIQSNNANVNNLSNSDSYGHNRNSSMPTSALLPQSLYPSSSAFASSSTMNFPNLDAQAVLANATAGLNASMPPPATSSSNIAGPSQQALGNLPGLYSTSGFDMVGILSRVAARRDPKTVLGPIDCSCSFLVVDIRKYDHPIVYASPTFTTLTGYESHEIIGKNCRFLQSPNGEVVKGSRRKYTDNVAVAHIKRLLGAGKECQASLINYRKGGTPFINLVTVVPIPWDTDEIAYHVGFQVDLVEQPNAILRNMRDGSYQVNYTVAPAPQPALTIKPAAKIVDVPANPRGGLKTELYDLLGQKEQNAILAAGDDSGNLEWLKFVLEHSDDFVHVLSLKGQFQYVSASVKRVLEYEPEDLLNKHISDICHPSDIIAVMREIKDASHVANDGAPMKPVNMVFRVRRKKTGYTWMECTGKFHYDAGKGRKALILAGRQRSVPALAWGTIASSGGLSSNEIWAKLSFDGLILWTLGPTHTLFGTTSEDLAGKSFYSLLSKGQTAAPSPEGDKASLAFEKALLAAADGLPQTGASSVNYRLQRPDGSAREVITTFFATGVSGLETSDESSSPDSSDSDGGNLPLSMLAPRRSEILIQVKLAGQAQRANCHPASENVFEEMDTTRGTSWQYELHQLRIANRKLREEIAAARSGKGVTSGTARKRKADDADAPALAKPNADFAAPLHQQTPGYGLAPAEIYGTWQ